MARNRFKLRENEQSRPYLPILEACAPRLLRANREAPDKVGLILEAPTTFDIFFATPAEIAAMLLDIAGRSGPEARQALREIAKEVALAKSEEPGFDCAIATRTGCALFRLPSQSLAEEGAYAVSSTVALFRGFEDPAPGQGAPPLPGFGYAVRAAGCAVCQSWSDALRALKIPSVGRVAPSEQPMGGEICVGCWLERDRLRAIASEQYGMDAAAVDAAMAPEVVIATAQLTEDWLASRG